MRLVTGRDHSNFTCHPARVWVVVTQLDRAQQTADGRTRSIRRSIRRSMSVDETQADILNDLLWAAALHGKVEELRALVELGADYNVKKEDGATPLHDAAQNGHANTVCALVELGVDCNVKQTDGCTPLHLAALYGHVDAMRALVELGADCNVKSADKCTPLHFAAGNGEFEVYTVRKEGRRQCGRWSSSGPTAMRRVRMDALRCI
eukprot:4105604-Pyramimonas_sp.AAC.1